jgi:lysophospholipase L1-like esterase
LVLITLLTPTSLLIGSLARAGAAAKRPLRQPVTRLTPLTRGSTYLALGDSVTFGYQEPNVVPPPDYDDPSSFHGYPEQIGAQLHVRVANLACPGETSASLVKFRAPSFGCENAYRSAFPLHVRYKGAQLAYAVSFLRAHPSVRLVSLMIGANDAFLCRTKTTDGCASPGEQRALVATITRDTRGILSQIRTRAHYTGQLAIVNYYSVNYAVPSISQQSLLLNHIVDTAARPFHVVIADGFGTFRAASFRFGQNPCQAGLLTELDGNSGSCGVHPSYSGQALLAQALIRAVRVSGPALAPAPDIHHALRYTSARMGSTAEPRAREREHLRARRRPAPIRAPAFRPPG